MVGVETSEDVPNHRVLLSHGLAEFFHDSLQVVGLELCHGVGEELPGVLVHIKHLELVVVDLDDVAGQHVLCLEQFPSDLVHVYRLLQKPACDDSQISLRRLVDRQAVILEVEAYNKDTVHIFRFRICEASLEAQDLTVVLEQLDEVLLRRLGDELLHRGQRIVPGSISSVGRRRRLRHGSSRQLHVDGRRQLGPKFGLEVVSSELVGVIDEEPEVR
mmetsp:Transcript_6602/g.15154  ORF Transcript_6602/g.15154 Transcript_6602/m.15154 type:complete len:217 (+) Transcript_6602:660-1310(+)